MPDHATRGSSQPLRLTPWERYMAVDHGPRHSMTCFSRFWLSRPVKRSALAAAVARVAGDNPLLAVRRRGNVWLPVDFDPDRQIDWSDTLGSVALEHQPPDDMLVRWTARVGRLGDLGLADDEHADERGTLVVLRFPHAVADGLAATAVVGQLCRVLAGRPARSPTRAELDARLTLGRTPRADRVRLRHELGRIARYFSHFPAELAPDRAGAAPEIACERVVASAESTLAIRTGARAVRATVNDVLVAALFRTLSPLIDSRDVIRIAVPTSLRADGNGAFSNQVSMVFIDRRGGRTPEAGLLGGVAAEMSHVKRWRLGHAMHSFLGVASRAGEGVLGSLVKLPGFLTTAVLSNLGEPLHAAETGWEGMRILAHDLLSPLRPGTNLSIVAVGHDGRLGLTARFAPDRISRGRAREILGRLLAEAEAMVAAA